MHILDIGGGFAGGCFDAEGMVQLGGVPDAVNAALALHFPELNVKVGLEHTSFAILECALDSGQSGLVRYWAQALPIFVLVFCPCCAGCFAVLLGSEGQSQLVQPCSGFHHSALIM